MPTTSPTAASSQPLARSGGGASLQQSWPTSCGKNCMKQIWLGLMLLHTAQARAAACNQATLEHGMLLHYCLKRNLITWVILCSILCRHRQELLHAVKPLICLIHCYRAAESTCITWTVLRRPHIAHQWLLQSMHQLCRTFQCMPYLKAFTSYIANKCPNCHCLSI